MAEICAIPREERLLAITIPYYERADGMDAPRCLTMHGMSEIIGVTPSNIQSYLKNLERKGFVVRKKKHVERRPHNGLIDTFWPTWEAIQYMKRVEAISGIPIRMMPTLPFRTSTKSFLPYDPIKAQMKELEARFVAVEAN
jgi:hypothetical protein